MNLLWASNTMSHDLFRKIVLTMQIRIRSRGVLATTISGFSLLSSLASRKMSVNWFEENETSCTPTGLSIPRSWGRRLNTLVVKFLGWYLNRVTRLISAPPKPKPLMTSMILILDTYERVTGLGDSMYRSSVGYFLASQSIISSHLLHYELTEG